ncbi:MAG: GtrA family protein [Gammaproteobacteria bacterium]|nr:GtrA family protein [Gammaproteobacteria bacterium]
MIGQLFRFGAVGFAALLVHWCLATFLIWRGMQPLLGNFLGFIVAFGVSYLGHRHLTFATSEARHSKALPRFVIVAVTGFCVNQAMFYLLLRYTSIHYAVSLLLVLGAVAAMTFVLSKAWAFR